MFTKSKTALLLGAIAAANVSNANSLQNLSEKVNISGFGSVIAGQVIDGDSYVSETEYFSEYENSLDFKQETKFGLQMDVKLDENLTATVQGVSRGANDYDVELEWAYLTYDVMPNVTLQGGRINAPAYMHSQSLSVGRTYHWMRPPSDMYNAGFNKMDGLSTRYNGTVGDWDFYTQYTFGKNDEVNKVIENKLGDGNGQQKVEDIHVVNFGLSKDNWSFRLTGWESNFEVPNAPFEVDTKVNFYAAAAKYDNWDYFVMAELTSMEFKDDIALTQNRDSGYVSVGKRIEDWTVHGTYSFKDEDKNKITTLENDSDSIILGVNYNISPSAVAKVEYVNYSQDSNDPTASGDASTVAFGVDFVF